MLLVHVPRKCIVPGVTAALAVVAGLMVAGLQGALVVIAVIVAYLVFISHVALPLQKSRGAEMFARPAVARIAQSHLVRPEPAPHIPVITQYKDAMVPITHPDLVDEVGLREQHMLLNRDPLNTNSSDHALNKQWVESRNKQIIDAARMVRPDMHIVYDDDDQAAHVGHTAQHAQHTQQPFRPAVVMDEIMHVGAAPSRRQFVHQL